MKRATSSIASWQDHPAEEGAPAPLILLGGADERSVDIVEKVAFPFYFGEFIVILWLAFIGAKPRAAEA